MPGELEKLQAETNTPFAKYVHPGTSDIDDNSYQNKIVSQSKNDYLLFETTNVAFGISSLAANKNRPWTHYLPTGIDNLPAATAHTNTRL